MTGDGFTTFNFLDFFLDFFWIFCILHLASCVLQFAVCILAVGQLGV